MGIMRIACVSFIFMVILVLQAVTASAISSPDPCVAHQSYDTCITHDACAWCGNASFIPPSALCHSKGSDFLCCAWESHFNIALVCDSKTQECLKNTEPTVFGENYYTACCSNNPALNETICGNMCYAQNGSEICCDEMAGPVCNATQSCCRYGCCNAGENCCRFADFSWCCPASATCGRSMNSCLKLI